MPRPRFDNLDPDKKEKLFAAARREFSARPYESASINTILDEAGFSKGSFYYYFDDKADLALTLLAVDARPSLEPVRQLKQPETVDEFWRELDRLNAARFTLMFRDRVAYESMLRIGAAVMREPALLERTRTLMDEGRRLMGAFFERGVAVGALRSDIPMGTLMALIESAKSTLYASTFPGTELPSDAEIEAFGARVIDLAKRIASR